VRLDPLGTAAPAHDGAKPALSIAPQN